MPGKRASLFDRWLAKVDTSDGLLVCWKWTGARSHKRRGRRGVIREGGRGSRMVSAARVALALATDGDYNKTDAEGFPLEVLHDTPNGCRGCTPDFECVNPTHLRWGTRTENEQDKHRSPR